MKENLIIKKQIESNILKNIYGPEIASFPLDIDIKTLIEKLKNDEFTSKEIKNLIHQSAETFLQTLALNNQFLQFNQKQREALVGIYQRFCDDLASSPQEELSLVRIEHFKRLRQFLLKSNPVSAGLDAKTQTIHTYLCSEYSSIFQMETLEMTDLRDPILDIGCGFHGNLVTDLRAMGYEAYGMDRFCETNEFLTACDWQDYDFGEEKWATIISNMAFSNQFLYHFYLQESVSDYVVLYDKILSSLEPGGHFYYAPSLPFIEESLPQNQFIVHRQFLENEQSYTLIEKIDLDNDVF